MHEKNVLSGVKDVFGFVRTINNVELKVMKLLWVSMCYLYAFVFPLKPA